jgi:hypothetical protein
MAKSNLLSAGYRQQTSRAGDAEPSHVPARNVVPAPCSASLRRSPPSGCLKRCHLVTVTDVAGAASVSGRDGDVVLPFHRHANSSPLFGWTHSQAFRQRADLRFYLPRPSDQFGDGAVAWPSDRQTIKSETSRRPSVKYGTERQSNSGFRSHE